MTRVIVLGFDGLSPEMAASMPSLSQLNLYSMDSLIPLTYSSWPSIMSGVNPGKHGIYDFFKYNKSSDGGWSFDIVTSLDLQYPRINEIIELAGPRHNPKYAFINPIPSYPLSPLRARKGFVASLDFFTPKPVSSDDSILRESIDLEKLSLLIDKFMGTLSCDRVVEYAREKIRLYHSMLKWFIDAGYDLVWITINLPDALLHRCPQALPQNGKRYLESILEELDSMVSYSRSRADNLIVVSDHGFKEYKGVVRLNSLLYKNGYAVRARDESSILRLDSAFDDRPEKNIKLNPKLVKLSFAIARGPLRRVLRRGYWLAYRVATAITGKGITYDIPGGADSRESKAFTPSGSKKATPKYVILLNDLSIRRDLIDLLEKAGLYAFYSRDLLWGPHVPDFIVFTYGLERHPVAGTTYETPIDDSRTVTNHSRFGVLAVATEDPDLVSATGDVVHGFLATPLALCGLGVPLDDYMDGVSYLGGKCKGERIDYRARWTIRKRLARSRISTRVKIV
ncbi:MAG: alkaline phosphatase family protein [Desulfurococcales archaeon]|nr:alkaline phosphatase family protein [Desulfurococcales archaeon]